MSVSEAENTLRGGNANGYNDRIGIVDARYIHNREDNEAYSIGEYEGIIDEAVLTYRNLKKIYISRLSGGILRSIAPAQKLKEIVAERIMSVEKGQRSARTDAKMKRKLTLTAPQTLDDLGFGIHWPWDGWKPLSKNLKRQIEAILPKDTKLIDATQPASYNASRRTE
jgi:hypothetical protein